MKITVFSDLHYFAGDISKAIFDTEKKPIRYSLPTLKKLIGLINNEFKSDLAVNLGDIIQDTVDRELDKSALEFMYSALKDISCPCVSVFGNHDLKMMNSVEEVEEILGQKSTRSLDLCGWHLVFLSPEVRAELGTGRGGCYKAQYISQKTLDWLSEDLKKNSLPTIVFTHYTVAEDPTVTDDCMFIKNRAELKAILEDCGNVKAVISGHLHEARVICENGIDYYVIPSMIADHSKDELTVGSYMNIETDEKELKVSFMKMSKEDFPKLERDKKMKISGAIFDMDGTLVDSLGFWDYLWESLGKRYLDNPAFRPDEVTALGVRTSTLYGAADLIHKNCGIAESTDLLFPVLDELLGNYYKEKVELKAGAEELLTALKENGVKMCVATATAPHLLKILLDKFDLYRFFERTISCSDVGRGKEHPDVFIAAHEYLRTDKESTWIFEDSVVALETAVKANFNTVGVYDRYGFSAEKVKELSTLYVGRDDSLKSIAKMI